MKIISRILLLCFLLISSQTFAQEDSKGIPEIDFTTSPQNIISVSIGGEFFINGTFTAFINERLDHFITRIIMASVNRGEDNNGSDNVDPNAQYNQILSTIVKRNIKILKRSGDDLIVDLEKYYLTGDLSQNPYIQQDDIIIFPKINLETNYVVVDGAVNKRIKFPFVKGDKLSDALLFAHGIDSAYNNVNYAEIIRISYDGKSTVYETVELKNSDDYKLFSGDIVRVIGETYNRKDYKVLVVGEVDKPGYVYISKNNTTIREVIERAGGFTNNAWLAYSELVRGNTPDRKVLQELLTSTYEESGQIDQTITQPFVGSVEYERWKMFRTANLYEDHNQIFRVDADLALLSKNRFVDFTKLDDITSEENEFIVEDGDVIFVPEKMDLVYVMGQVANPGQYNFDKTYSIKNYISQAGGFSDSAEDESEIYILQGKSYNWVQIGEEVMIEPGDYIWVRKDPARSFNFYLQRVSAITGIVGSIATIVLLVTQLVK